MSVAVGRDYGDVPPSRGVYKGEADCELVVGVSVRQARSATLLGGSVAGMRVRGTLVVRLLGIGLWKADYLTSLAEADLFNDPVVYAKTTPYQRIVVTAGRSGFQLFLNGHLQFHSADEYRYHEALVHPAMALAGHPRRVLVLGGGDGLALREILKIPRSKRSRSWISMPR